MQSDGLRLPPFSSIHFEKIFLYEHKCFGLAVFLKKKKLLSAVLLFGSHYLHTTIPSRSRYAVLLPSEPASQSEKY